MTLKIQNLFWALALTPGQISTAIEKLTGKPIPSDLISRAADSQPITAIAADNLCKWLSKEMGREIRPEDTDLKVHPASTLPDEEMTTEAMLGYLQSQGYRITAPVLLYQEGNYLAGDLAPRHWKALANRRVPWPKDMDPKVALHELAPFMTHRLLQHEATAMGRDISTLVKPNEDI